MKSNFTPMPAQRGHKGKAAGRGAGLLFLLLILQSCALRPTLQDWGLLDPPPSEAPQAVAPRTRPVMVESHRFPLSKDENVVGSLAALQLRQSDTLADVGRHFGVGYEEIRAANPDLDPWVAEAGQRAIVPVRFVLPHAARRGIVVNLAAMRLFHFPADAHGTEVITYPVGIGKEGRSTPTGDMSIARKKQHPTWYPTANIRSEHRRKGHALPGAVSPGPDNPLGNYALYLSRQPYLIHGTNKPYSIGWRASNGCIRLYPENIEQLFPVVSVKEPVTVVNQPYLVGADHGVLYLQAYRPHEELNETLLRKRILAELKKLEAAQPHPLDWAKVDRILDEALGVPLPVSANTPSAEAVLGAAPPVAHPGRWFGQPEIPYASAGGWQVVAAESSNDWTARRLAAVLNHQGPPIPARAVLLGRQYQVIAGPFVTAKAAQDAAKQMKLDLDLDGRLIAPDADIASVAAP